MTQSPNYFVQAKNLTQARLKSPELKAVSSVALQQTLKTLDQAFRDVWQQGKGEQKRCTIKKS